MSRYVLLFFKCIHPYILIGNLNQSTSLHVEISSLLSSIWLYVSSCLTRKSKIASRRIYKRQCSCEIENRYQTVEKVHQDNAACNKTIKIGETRVWDSVIEYESQPFTEDYDDECRIRNQAYMNNIYRSLL